MHSKSDLQQIETIRVYVCVCVGTYELRVFCPNDRRLVLPPAVAAATLNAHHLPETAPIGETAYRSANVIANGSGYHGNRATVVTISVVGYLCVESSCWLARES
ncbi:Uncharacterized protein FWK35_00014171 [Aphis craccivora]|uniref:Uncharacterized protein n=1 Tax=Aphis craccivora TaxID=307492 RepID=A0A6G0YMG0_APHCR|nr:Uncharacterized protein FWK35_00014171 [Aphis craccivora]